jgi:ABC-type nitrate/sulfonate/bicarbonate transport system substrate-binding protein
MVSGKLDVVSMSEPWRTRLKLAGGGVVWKEGSEVVPGMQWSFVAFGPTLLQENPELGRRFMAAYVKGIQAYRRGKTDRNIEILMKHTGLDRETVTEASWPRVSRDAAINVEAFMAFQRWAAERDYVDRILKPEEFWEPSFTQYAARARGGT